MLPQIETIPQRHMASGDVLSFQVYKFIGARPGKKVYIQSNLHGAEIVGNAVIHQLIEFLLSVNDTEIVGQIWLVPVCNSMSTNQRSHYFASGRYCIYEAKDWNRIFWDYEIFANDIMKFAQSQINFSPELVRKNYLDDIQQKFTNSLKSINLSSSAPYTEKFRYKLQSLSIDADYLIDLHSHTTQGINYLYYFCDREESAKYFLLPLGVLLDEYDGNAFDEAFIKPWLALEKYFKELGREIKFDVEAWTLELGTGMQMNPDSVEKGIKGIKNYLIRKGVLQTSDDIMKAMRSQDTSYKMSFSKRSQAKKYFAPTGGMIQSKVELGSSVKVGDLLYQILQFNKEGKLPTVIDVFAEQDGLIYDSSTNHAVNEGEFVLGLISVTSDQ